MINFYYDPVLGLTNFSFKDETPIGYNYSKQKAGWVTFNNGKESMKLRQFIKWRATELSKVSNGSYNSLRGVFIEAYNIGGVEAIEIIYKEAVLKILKSLN